MNWLNTQADLCIICDKCTCKKIINTNILYTFISLCFVVQMAEGVKMHYREMLPLTNASESFLKEFEELQSEVSNPVCAFNLEFKTDY